MAARILYFADNGFRGCGATVRLNSGEPCTISIAQTGVRVRKSRLGFWGPILYNEKDVYKNALCTGALAYLFPDTKIPTNISTLSLKAFVNAILSCDNAATVCRTLNEAVSMAEQKAGCSIANIPADHFPQWARP